MSSKKWINDLKNIICKNYKLKFNLKTKNCNVIQATKYKKIITCYS